MKILEWISKSGSSRRIETLYIPEPQPLITHFWPWNALRVLREENSQLERQLHACQIAAVGAFHQFPKDGTMFTDANVWSPALAEVMKLCGKLDKYRGEPNELIHINCSVQCPKCQAFFPIKQSMNRP